MNNIELTTKELQVLVAITESDFYENGRESIVWDFSVYDNLPFKGKTRSGVISSLTQKGIIYVTEKEPKWIKVNNQRKRNPYWDPYSHGTIYITELGYNILDNKNLINEHGSFINH